MSNLKYKERGTVKAVSGCIAKVVGLQNCFLGQLLKLGAGSEGIVMGFDLDVAQVLIVKETEPLSPGKEAIGTLEAFNMPVGENTIGRIITPMGETLDGLGAIKYDAKIPYFNAAPALMDREGLGRSFETGIKLIDTMLPLGHGQRSLVLGDKMTGKTTIGTDIIMNQKGKNVICIYCGIGKTKSAMGRVIDIFKEKGCFDYTMILLASAASSPGLQYLAPYAACSLGEYFMYQGKDVFIFFDDFTTHAWAYRELSLLMEIPPGRDSYPGDIFFLHSRMIERAAQLDKKHGGGAMTFLGVVQLLESDMTAYVPTNLVSMTDGQMSLNAQLFNENFRPAVDVGLSVSRVGSRVQWKATKSVTKSLRMEFIQYKELVKMSKLQSGGSEETKETLRAGKVFQALLTQQAGKPVPLEIQIIMFYAKEIGALKKIEKEHVDYFMSGLAEYTDETDPMLRRDIRAKKDLDDDLKSRMKKVAEAFVALVMARVAKEKEERDRQTA
ncbi:MAG TPA: F0F1 ATP synthase subunit alpha [Candidatus Omnitrophota bacterium]|nr:F0F1 ATP synthase subunit alpha [Candidatus Omnitrophota bacterium]HRK61572.1 F0F1 ATP synthase subunit alpha [Candidatus Omnitrophota bacterium]